MELRTRSPNQSSGDLALDTRNTTEGSSEIAASNDVILDQSSEMIWRGGEHNFEGNHPALPPLHQLITLCCLQSH
jgi:hypothetical protein